MAKLLPCGRKRPSEAHPSRRTEETWISRLNDFLKKNGLRSTRPREQIARIALSKKSHFEIQSLVKEVHLKHPEISPATVYRSVATLCEAGLLTETLQSNGGVALYEASLDEEHHDHVVCLDCNEIIEFHDSGLEKAQNRAMETLGFAPIRHRHIIYAQCEKLKKQS